MLGGQYQQSAYLPGVKLKLYGAFFGSHGQVNYGQLAAYAMLYALPAVILYCAKELVLFPRQTCPEHKHPLIHASNVYPKLQRID
jgi:hypothetical protein